MTHDELEVYEKMNWETPSDELADAVENLVRLVKRLQKNAKVLLFECEEELKGWHKVRDYILERTAYPTVTKLHSKDLVNFMEEVTE